MLMTVLSPEQAIEFIKYEEYNKGIQEGEAKGATAKALRIAQEMKSKGFSLNLIAEITGLSEDKIEGIC